VIPKLNSNEKFSVEEYFEIIQNIKTKHGKLKSRVNRSYNESLHFNSALEGNNIINSVVREIYFFMTVNTCSLNLVMFIVSIILLEQRELIVCHHGRKNLRITSENKQFTSYLNKWLRDLIDFDIRLFDKFPSFQVPENEIDFLGRVYESLRTVADRSQKGAYFTPNSLVQDINVLKDSRIFDPCSGTGSIIMSVVSKSHKPQNITLQDVDQLALNIALVNFVLFFENAKDLVKIRHASSFDSKSFAKSKFDIIITNPPYGAKLPFEEKEKLVADYPDLLTSESFSIVLYNSIKRLRPKKKLIFIFVYLQ
jgi:type I restriction-modification system DNA methylase subunit